MSKQHARYSPSKLDALAKCPRFKRVEEQTDRQSAADEGTMMHDAFERRSTKGLTEEQADAVSKVIGYVESLEAAEGAHGVHEVKLELEDLTYGFADYILITPSGKVVDAAATNLLTRRAHVADAKFTRIEAEHGFQVRAYAACILEAYEDVVEVVTHVISPRLNSIETNTYDRSLLPKVRNEIELLYRRIENPFSTKPVPHMELCRMCAWASECPAVCTGVATVAAMQQTIVVPATFDPAAITLPEDRAVAQSLATVLENWAEQVKASNTEFVANGGEIPGFKMVSRGTGKRVDPAMTQFALDALLEKGYTREMLCSALTLSVNKLAKNLAEMQGGKEGVFREAIDEVIGSMLVEGKCQFLQKSAKPKGGTGALSKAKQIEAT